MKKISTKTLIVVLLVVAALYFMMQSQPAAQAQQKSYYSPTSPSDLVSGKVMGTDIQNMDEYAPANMSGSINTDIGCSMKAGVGLASSLLPHDVASQEDYGQFAPNDILKGQNFLDPRSQVGWPETIGGTIRNGNHDLRADIPNPKDAYVWNNSTIVPDLMQRNLFCNK